MLRAADLGVGPQADRGGRRRRCARHRVKCVPVSATTGTRFCVSPRRSAVLPHFTSSTFADRFSACAARRATDFLLRRMVLMSPFLGRRRKRGELKPADSLRPAGSSRAVVPARRPPRLDPLTQLKNLYLSAAFGRAEVTGVRRKPAMCRHSMNICNCPLPCELEPITAGPPKTY
jgi:hypothetical protein